MRVTQQAMIKNSSVRGADIQTSSTRLPFKLWRRSSSLCKRAMECNKITKQQTIYNLYGI